MICTFTVPGPFDQKACTVQRPNAGDSGAPCWNLSPTEFAVFQWTPAPRQTILELNEGESEHT